MENVILVNKCVNHDNGLNATSFFRCLDNILDQIEIEKNGE